MGRRHGPDSPPQWGRVAQPAANGASRAIPAWPHVLAGGRGGRTAKWRDPQASQAATRVWRTPRAPATWAPGCKPRLDRLRNRSQLALGAPAGSVLCIGSAPAGPARSPVCGFKMSVEGERDDFFASIDLLACACLAQKCRFYRDEVQE